MLTVAEALAKILDQATLTPTVRVAVEGALGCTLAEDVASDVDSPPHDKATVDGYAIVAADLAAGSAVFDVIEEVTAGEVATRVVSRGQASRVMTGAPIPAGADAMVMIERSENVPPAGSATQRVRLMQDNVPAGQNILRRATSLSRGDIVLRKGTVIRPIEIGLLAEVGRVEVLVHRRPSLAVLATGNELVDAGALPAAGQIRDSNGPMLLAAARRAGAEGLELGIARDEPAQLATCIARGLACDVLVISGGVSAGVLDLVPVALRAAGVEEVFHKVEIKPGKPLWFGVRQGSGDPTAAFGPSLAFGQTLVFGLPGNPVSSLVCFELFVRPTLAKISGAASVGLLPLAARLDADFLHRGDRPTYFPGRLHVGGCLQPGPAGASVAAGSLPAPLVSPLAWRGSGDLRTLTDASVLIHFPAGERAYAAGDLVEVLLLS
jgi:molybdopterin molybdotransferase